MQFADINKTTIHYRVVSGGDDKPVLVFANSLGTDFRIWSDVVSRLAGEFSIVLYDKRGHGLSALGPLPYSIEEHAADLAGLLDRLDIRNAIVCGLSVGGLIAQSLYQQRADLVRALILCDTAHKIGTAESWNARIAQVEIAGLESILDAVMERWFTPFFRHTESVKLAGYSNMLLRQSAAGYTATCAALRDADFTDAASKIAVPTLCIVGDQDASTPPDLVLSTANLIPNARFEVIKDAGHIPCVEQPEALAKLICGFSDLVLHGENRMSEPEGQSARYHQGMATRRAVLGEDHVERAQSGSTDFDRPFQDLITEAAWGHVWSRPTLTKRERSIVTIALLAALGQDEEVAMHIRATTNTGATRDDICEALLHVAIYAGVPAANHAIKIAKQVFEQMDANVRSEAR